MLPLSATTHPPLLVESTVRADASARDLSRKCEACYLLGSWQSEFFTFKELEKIAPSTSVDLCADYLPLLPVFPLNILFVELIMYRAKGDRVAIRQGCY